MRTKTFVFMVILGLLSVSALPSYMQGDALVELQETWQQGIPFRAWPIVEQYEFSRMLPAFIAAHGGKEGLYIPPSIAEILKHTYGMPGEGDLTQEQAQVAAIAYIRQINGEGEEALRGHTWTYSFLLDDVHNPQWLITVYDGIYTAQNRLYRLSIPARGGEIALLYDHHAAEPTPDELLEQFSYTLPQDREEWTYQQKAAYGKKVQELMALFPDFNDDQSYVIHSLPAEGEVSYEEALAFAKDVLRSDYGGEKGWNEADYPLRSAEFVRVSHSKDNIQTPYWGFVMGKDVFYQIYIFAGMGRPSLLVIYTSEKPNG